MDDTDIGGRYTKHHVTSWGIKGWTVVDHKYQQDNQVRDWRSKGVHKRIWRGTEEAASNLVRLLNKAAEDGYEFITKGEKSQSQAIAYAMLRKRAHAPKPQRAQVVSAFKHCQCGSMYKGEKHCG